MKAETRLDSAFFQLTPTRTRCDLVISANGKTEKLASGLLNPFLTHLKTAQEQIAKGGYSITLEPDPRIDAVWFTKGTVERFVRFVSTPEVLERVSTIESEILQIEEAINIQSNDDIGINTVGEGQKKQTSGSKYRVDADAEKALVLYKPGSNPQDSNGLGVQEENSKVQLLRVLETRKTVLQKEQAMAFARAVAAGFDMDSMGYLASFAEAFGALRLKEACVLFMDLWKRKHETGQWIELEAADAMASRHDFPSYNTSGIVLSGDNIEAWSGGDLSGESNGRAGSDMNSDPNKGGPQEHFQGQFHHPAFSQWPVHSGPPVYPPYPVHGMPYYPNYPVTLPYFQPPYPPPDDPRLNSSQRIGKRHSMDSKDSAVDSELSKRSNEGLDQDISEEDSQGRVLHKRESHSGKKKSGVVVIRNINYITSKGRDKSGSASGSSSESESGEDAEDSDTSYKKHKRSSRSSRSKGDNARSSDVSNVHANDGQGADSGNWEVFQSFLLRAEEKNQSAVDKGLFPDEREPVLRRKQKKNGSDPILERDPVDIHESRMVSFDSINGSATRLKKSATSDELLFSAEARSSGSQFSEELKVMEGEGRRYRRTVGDESMIYGHAKQIGDRNTLDPFVENEYQFSSKLEKGSPYFTGDDSFVIPLRSNSNDQNETEGRADIYMESELPTSMKDGSSGVKNRITYGPDDLSMLPERDFERDSVGYDPAMDYDLQVAVSDSAKLEVANQEDASLQKDEHNKKSDEEKKLKSSEDGSNRRKMDLLKKGKFAKSNPLTEAQKRAEKLRAYKADLQKVKKEKEEEETMRLEALKRERQKRIAARTNSTSSQSPMSKQPASRLPTKSSPTSHRGSKFSDSEPGSSSPLQRLPIRMASIGSNGSQRTTKTSRLSGIAQSENGLTRSASSLSDLKKGKNGPPAEAKVATLRRLSEPKHVNVSRASSMKSDSNQVVKKTLPNESQAKKISAIMHLDKSKSATLPELKIKSPKSTPDSVQKKAITEMVLQKEGGNDKLVSSGEVKFNNTLQEASYAEDNPVIEKTVLMLEKEDHPPKAFQTSEEGLHENGRTFLGSGRENTESLPQYAAIGALPSSVDISNTVDSEVSKTSAELKSYEVVIKDETKLPTSLAEEPYQAPVARLTSFEDPATTYSDNNEVASAEISKLDAMIEGRTTYVPHHLDSNSLAKELSKSQNKDSSKGFRKLLKFGRKGHSDHSVDSETSASDEYAMAASSNDVHMLKSLISQDDPHAGGTAQKASRGFSLLSPFRSKSSDKKMVT